MCLWQFFLKNTLQGQQNWLKYAETIRLASIQFSGFGWRTYDEQFCLRRAADPSSSWGEMDLELWVTVAAAATVGYGPRQVSNLHGNIVTNNNIAHASVANGGPFSTGNRSGGGVCFAFNKAQGCRFALCRFAHRCSACSRVRHNALSCRMLVGNSNARGQFGLGTALSLAGDRPPVVRRFNSRRAPATQAFGGARQLATAAQSHSQAVQRLHPAAAKSVLPGKPSNVLASYAN